MAFPTTLIPRIISTKVPFLANADKVSYFIFGATSPLGFFAVVKQVLAMLYIASAAKLNQAIILVRLFQNA